MIDVGHNPDGEQRLGNILNHLDNSSIRFVLTGSRRFEGHRLDANFDFVVDGSQLTSPHVDVVDWLVNLGFQTQTNTIGPDTIILELQQIRVLVVNNFKEHLAVFDMIDKNRSLYRLYKSTPLEGRKLFWQMLFKLAFSDPTAV